jgi:thioredoxin reductase (NADPH)
MTVHTSRRKFLTRSLMMATGATHRTLGIPGEMRLSGHGVSYCSTCDGPLFKGRKVIIVGGGNSAVTEALHMHHIGVDVTLVHRGDKLRAQDVLVKNLVQNNIPILFNTEVKEISGRHHVEDVLLYNNNTEETSTLAVQGVFIAIGYKPAVDLARKVGLELTPEGYIKHDQYRTNVPGIYTAGDVAGGYKQIVTAAGHGAEAAMTIFEDLINPYWK